LIETASEHGPDMQINNVFASLPVQDLAAAYSWYEKLFNRAPELTPSASLLVYTRDFVVMRAANE
jgi:hypothetical protein